MADKDKDKKSSSLGRKFFAATMAPAGAVVGGTYLGLEPDGPGIIDSAKYGAKKMYHGIAENKKEEAEADQEFKNATKRARSVKRQPNKGENTNPAGDTFKHGGSVGSASKRADGCAVRGKTKGRMV